MRAVGSWSDRGSICVCRCFVLFCGRFWFSLVFCGLGLVVGFALIDKIYRSFENGSLFADCWVIELRFQAVRYNCTTGKSAITEWYIVWMTLGTGVESGLSLLVWRLSLDTVSIGYALSRADPTLTH